MKWLIRLTVCLYPASWRHRYRTEFDALLEDITPHGRDFLDVFRSARNAHDNGDAWKTCGRFWTGRGAVGCCSIVHTTGQVYFGGARDYAERGRTSRGSGGKSDRT